MQNMPIYKSILTEFETRLEKYYSNELTDLEKAAAHLLLGGGKRIRPLLLILSTLDLQGNLDGAYSAAIALEMIHNYSLIHDDLPCMDNDDVRRGKPTVHKAFSEATAVLAGDYLLTQAFSVLANCKILNNQQALKMIQVFTRYSGPELLEGQSLDLKMSGQVGHIQDLNQIYLKKTSSLFCIALLSAAILANASKKDTQRLKEIGEKLGLVFQIMNDFKGIEKDQSQSKFTIFTLFSKQQAMRFMEKNLLEIDQLMEELSMPLTQLKCFIEETFRL